VTGLDELHAEVLRRLRALGVAHPERTVHLTIDVARHGAPLPVPSVLATLEDLRERGEVVHVGGGWRLPDGPESVRLEVSVSADDDSAPDDAASARTVWLVLIRGATVLSVHATEDGARARVADLDNFAAQVERRRVED
jgi:hypothetical protein